MTRTCVIYLLVLILFGAGIAAAIHFDFISFRNTPSMSDERTVNDKTASSSSSSLIPHPSSLPELPPGVQVKFVDVTEQAGIHFQHFDGHTEMEYIMETTGSGLGWLDYDQDGLMD